MAPKVYIILDDTDSDDDAMPEVEVAQADSSSTEHDSSTDAMVGFEGDSSSTGNSSSANEPMDASSADESTAMVNPLMMRMSAVARPASMSVSTTWLSEVVLMF